MKRKLIALAQKLNCMITRSHNDDSLFIDAPTGYVFGADGNLHCLVCGSYEDAIERLSYGIEKCEIVDCEVCEEALTFEQIHEAQKQELIFIPKAQ